MLAFGPRISITQLVERYYANLYRYAYRLSGSQADAEDLTQDAFMRAAIKLDQLRDADKARPWLYSIVRRAYLQKQRSGRNTAHVPLQEIPDVAEEVPDPLPQFDPEAVQKALQELPEPYRTAVLLYYFEDLSYREIADVMEVPIGTVMSRLARAKAALKARLLSLESVNSPMVDPKGRSAHGL